jgi:hypothetical protein
MKNIHVLPTDKPSRLIINWEKDLCYKSKPYLMEGTQNIYITNDEIVTEYSIGLYFIDIYNKTRHIFSPIYINKDTIAAGKFHTYMNNGNMCKKIIMTTDPILILNGVQAIDDEFLEWFVKNPTCEEVYISYGFFTPMGRQIDPLGLLRNHSQCVWKYKIIIPKEENHSDINSLIGKKVIWDSKEYTIIDKHNDSDFITIDDKNNSIVGLHWDNVCILKEETNYTMELNPHIGPFLLKNGFSKHKIRPHVYKDNVYYNSECIVTVLEDCYEIQFDEPEVGEVTTYTDSWSIPHLVGTLTWNDLIDRNYIK